MAKANSRTEGAVVDALIGLDLPVESLPMEAGVSATYKNETVETTSANFQVAGYKKATANTAGTSRSVSVDRRPKPRQYGKWHFYGTTSASADFTFEDAGSEASVFD